MMPAPSPAKMESSAVGANGVFTVFDNQLFAPHNAYQQLPLPMSAAEPSAQRAVQVGRVSAAVQQPSCSCGMGDDSMRELQRALQHRHSMLKTYNHLTEALWEQLQQVLGTCEKLPAAAGHMHHMHRPCALCYVIIQQGTMCQHTKGS